jgi:hypothetical protein
VPVEIYEIKVVGDDVFAAKRDKQR